MNLKPLTRTKSTAGEERLESAGALALQATAAGTVSPKADSDTDGKAGMEMIGEGNSNEKEIPEIEERPWNITALDEKAEPWSRSDSFSSLLSGCVENRDLEMLEEKEMAVLGLQQGQASRKALSP